MKKRIAAVAVLTMTAGMALSACGSSGQSSQTTAAPAATAASEAANTDEKAEGTGGETEAAASTWKPSKTVSIICCSSAGGGSDINSRAVVDAFSKIGVDANFVVDYKNDGGGAVGWQYVARATDEYTLMCYGFGDTINMVDNTNYSMEDYRGIAIVSAEQEVMLATPECKYADFKEAVEAAKGGTVVTIAGSGGVDLILYKQLLEATGLTEAQLSYVQHNSTGEAIVTALGNHSDFVVGKPSSVISYVESGELVPYAGFQDEKFAAPLDTAPTAAELGYEGVEAPMWRGFVASKDMPEEAYQYYCDIFRQLVDSDEWMTSYVEQYAASPLFLVGEEADAYMRQAESDYKAQ